VLFSPIYEFNEFFMIELKGKGGKRPAREEEAFKASTKDVYQKSSSIEMVPFQRKPRSNDAN
jgi:hypothetical protein